MALRWWTLAVGFSAATGAFVCLPRRRLILTQVARRRHLRSQPSLCRSSVDDARRLFFRMTSGLLLLTSSSKHDSGALGRNDADGMTAITIILAMSFASLFQGRHR